MAAHSSILAWEIPQTDEPVGYSPRGRKGSDIIEPTSREGKRQVTARFASGVAERITGQRERCGKRQVTARFASGVAERITGQRERCGTDGNREGG